MKLILSFILGALAYAFLKGDLLLFYLVIKLFCNG